MRIRIISLHIIILLLISCDYEPVHPALWTIGKNKKEFQKVYDYYCKPEDSLKLKAAEFLIHNMDNHYYFAAKDEEKVDHFFQTMSEQITITNKGNSKLFAALRRNRVNHLVSKGLRDGSLPKPKYHRHTDINNIKADFLIENIEYAFKAWKFPWASDYSFDDFCKYILPYRYGNEAPSSWRKTIFEKYKWIADTLKSSNALEAAVFVNEQFQDVLSASKIMKDNGFKLKISNQLDVVAFTSCIDQAGLGVCVLRSLGIPAAIVSIPQWGTYFYGHETIGIFSLENKWRTFNFGGPGPILQKEHLIAPKMFIKRYDKMNRFKPVLEDASSRIMNTKNIEVEVKADKDDEIFLCVFGNLSWVPIFKGENKKSKVLFKDVGYRKAMYLAAVKKRGKLKAVSPVFLPDSLGNITYYVPSKTERFSASLNRKSTGLKTGVNRLRSLIGGEFSTSDDKAFSNKKQLCKIDSILSYHNNIIKCSEQSGKYLRYDFPQSLNSNFDGPAELSFYTTVGRKLKKINGRYFGSSQLSIEHIKLMTDDNMLSYVEVWDCNEKLSFETGRYVLRENNEAIWLGVELDSTTTITHIGICPRNDKNGIYPEMRYELFYWDNEWISLGVKVAKSNSITYDEIPENALLWLRNLDEGKEERIFTLKNGNQIWW